MTNRVDQGLAYLQKVVHTYKWLYLLNLLLLTRFIPLDGLEAMYRHPLPNILGIGLVAVARIHKPVRVRELARQHLHFITSSHQFRRQIVYQEILRIKHLRNK